MSDEAKPVAGSERLVKLLGIYSRLIGAEVKKLDMSYQRLDEMKEEIDILLDGADYAKSFVAESVEALGSGCEQLAETFINLDDLYARRDAGLIEEEEEEAFEVDNDDTNGFAEATFEIEESDDADESTEALITEEDVGAFVGP